MCFHSIHVSKIQGLRHSIRSLNLSIRRPCFVQWAFAQCMLGLYTNCDATSFWGKRKNYTISQNVRIYLNICSSRRPKGVGLLQTTKGKIWSKIGKVELCNELAGLYVMYMKTWPTAAYKIIYSIYTRLLIRGAWVRIDAFCQWY